VPDRPAAPDSSGVERRHPVHTRPVPLLTRILIVAAALLFADQVTKSLAVAFLSGRGSVPMIPDIFHLTLVRNAGMAFGLFPAKGAGLTILTTGIILGLVIWMIRMPRSWGIRFWLGLGLVLGGAVGNWVDRLHTGGVIDFLDFRIWPVFNLADSGITCGAVWIIFQLLRGERRGRGDKDAPDPV